MKDILRSLIRDAVESAAKRGLIDVPDMGSVRIEISRAKDERFGDYATNAALALASKLNKKPRDLATAIMDNLDPGPGLLAKAEIAGPGFINLFLDTEVWRESTRRIHAEKGKYGAAAEKEGPRILLEFVSANPTGPLHVGHGRGAAVGDTLGRLLKYCGYPVETEYYVNDTGNQMRILGASLLHRFKELAGDTSPFPDNHYQGEYMRDLARELQGTSLGESLLNEPPDKALALASGYACDRILEGIQEDLGVFGVTYDSYFRENTLHQGGAVAQALEDLKTRGKAEYKEGALWFVMDESEDEKDRVLVRANGDPTYFAADVAYHKNKMDRGYDRLIDIWGSDHHGYVPRVKSSMEAFGYPASSLKVLLVQFVNLVREGKKISMSTRSGEFITLREVLDEVGPDAARFFFLTKRCDSHLDFDLDLAKKQSRDNPVYYVQYAHARVASIFRIAAERSIDTDMSDPDLTALSLPDELGLMKSLADFPDMLSEAAETLEPHRVTFYLMDLAERFHAYYHDNRVLIEDTRVKKARLYLVDAVRQVLANGLGILGVSAPDRM